MIRCSHCGKLAPTGALSCQNCGMPLVSGGAGIAGAGQSEQQELPAWLESLRAHERPVPGGQENRQPFSLDELVDEDSMPSWMRQDRQKVHEGGNSDSLPVIPAVSAKSNQETQNTPANGFQAGSLIDERSLPTWMRESQGQGNGQMEAGQNVSAHSLVDQQGLPSWIKDLSQAAQQTPTPPSNAAYGLPSPTMNNYGLPEQPQTPIMHSYGLPAQAPLTPPAAVSSAPRVPSTPPTSEPPVAPAQGFSAHDLLDVQSMPSWMSNAQGPGQGPGPQPATRPVPTSQGFSAGELIDQRSVPAWMRNLQGQERSDPQSAMGVPVNGMGQTTGMGQGIQGTTSGEGMPAGSLLDKNSMPSWMQENQLGGNTQPQQFPGQDRTAGPQPDMNAMPSWLQESQLSSSAQPPQPTGQGLSAGSLLDANAMPAWMQESQLSSSAQPPQPTGQGMSARSLLDMNAMPAWMQESQPGSGAQSPQPTGQGMSAGSLIDMNAMPAWMQENQTGNSPQGASQGGQGMAAGSLIDMNSMPAWMRNSDNGQPAPGAGARPGQIQARPVPSRPRNEITQQEQSEVAANVFSSMLGVAASAPALPGQEPMVGNNLGVAQGQPMPSMPPFQQAQPSIPGWQQPAPNQYNQGGQPQAWQMSGAMPTGNPSPAPNVYAPTNQPGAAGNWPQRANTPEQPAWGGYPTADKLGVNIGTNAGAEKNKSASGHAQNTETKKKGFFDSIRDFFYH